MGQKVNPVGLRLGVNKTWKSKWYVDPREYADTLHEDLILRKELEKCPETKGAEISEVEIIRQPQRITVVIETSKPGVLIGAKGATIEKIGERLQKVAGKKIQLKIKELKKPEVNAQLIALNVARQLKSKSSFRKVLKQCVSGAMRGGAQGIKIRIAGRLAGAEMARVQQHKEGRIPLHTFRADIDYGFAEANTTFGLIGVKVWVFNGEILKKDMKEDAGQLLVKKRKKAAVQGE
ncbi:MAG: 30S ribosomal protein S3 [Spirochaetia bacterium]|nr:30S ribosomal protein S3 [Spirochaetia bacterium]